MDEMFTFDEDKKIDIFTKTAKNIGVVASAAEKDFWLTWVLGKIFADENLSKVMMFKGGTSLSKVFNLIGRFSEDIDLIFDWRLIANQESFKKKSTRNQQDIFNKKINEDGRRFIKNELLGIFNNMFSPLCQCIIGNDENCIEVQYPKLFADDYIKPSIVLELGPLASWLPSNTYEIKSFVAEQFPHLFKNPTYKLKAINAERTFWEKATILHKESNRAKEKALPKRYSRHYYDLAMMAKDSATKDKALTDFYLLKDVVEFLQQFYPATWAKYEEIETNGLKLLPQDFRLEALEADYQAMQNMIFDKKLTFSQIIETIAVLEQEINLKLKAWLDELDINKPDPDSPSSQGPRGPRR